MNDLIYAFLAQRWSGLAIAGTLLLLGLLLLRITRRGTPRLLRWLGGSLVVLAIPLAIGAGLSMWRVRSAFRQFPAPGKLYDVGGYRMHLVAEGDAKGGPSVIWIPGSHGAGNGLNHLHKAMRGETRSIIFDRPGTGWSDQGPFPRRTGREADELATLLDKAGERGPFIVVGHSYGGLLGANFARRYPEKIAAVVMADGTPPDVFLYLPDGGGMGIPEGLVKQGRSMALRRMFGLDQNQPEAAPPGDTTLARVFHSIDSALADVNPAIVALRNVPDWATPSVFEEWRRPKDIADATVYDGELGDLPVYVVIPAGKASAPEVRAIGVGETETERARSFLERARVRYLDISSRSQLIHTPAGTGHLYPFETPEALLTVVRGILADSATRATVQPDPR